PGYSCDDLRDHEACEGKEAKFASEGKNEGEGQESVKDCDEEVWDHDEEPLERVTALLPLVEVNDRLEKGEEAER
ncbi:XK-related protein, partial [Caligus rogercresseyi]